MFKIEYLIINQVISFNEGKELADQYGIDFFETSAKSGLNVNESYYSLAKSCLNIIGKENIPISSSNVVVY